MFNSTATGWTGIVWTGALFALAASVPGVATAHEPVFSPGPHTIYQGGVSTSVGASVVESGARGTQVGLDAGAIYGITADLNLAVGVPVEIARQTHEGKRTGVGDAVMQVKWRPWKSLTKGRIDSLSVLGGVKLPVGHHDLTDGNTGYTVGLTAAREDQRYYLFGSARYATQTVGLDGVKPGDVFRYDVATGVRPLVLEYDQPDAVVLVEMNGRSQRPAQGETVDRTHQALGGGEQTHRTRRQAHSGGTVRIDGGTEGGTELAVSPELLLSWGPVMLKGGVQFPFFDTFDASRATPDYRIKSSLIVQF